MVFFSEKIPSLCNHEYLVVAFVYKFQGIEKYSFSVFVTDLLLLFQFFTVLCVIGAYKNYINHPHFSFSTQYRM